MIMFAIINEPVGLAARLETLAATLPMLEMHSNLSGIIVGPVLF